MTPSPILNLIHDLDLKPVISVFKSLSLFFHVLWLFTIWLKKDWSQQARDCSFADGGGCDRQKSTVNFPKSKVKHKDKVEA